MREQIMRVSPTVFSEMQEKVIEFWGYSVIWPNFDRFAEWAHNTFCCVYYTTYRIVVVWEWGSDRKWDFPENGKNK